jgi:hypothetical protein
MNRRGRLWAVLFGIAVAFAANSHHVGSYLRDLL